MKYPTTIGLGVQIGDGCQHQPWIHICDLLNIILFSIANEEISGILNGVSPKVIIIKIFIKYVYILSLYTVDKKTYENRQISILSKGTVSQSYLSIMKTIIIKK